MRAPFASVLSSSWSCLAPVLYLLLAQRWILGVGEVPGCPTASTPRGMQGFTSTPAHGVPLVGHCLFWSKSAGWGIKEAFYFHIASLGDADCAVTHSAPTRGIVLPSWQTWLPPLQSLPLEFSMLPQGFFQVKLTIFKNNKAFKKKKQNTKKISAHLGQHKPF